MAAIQGMPREPRTTMDVEASRLLGVATRVRPIDGLGKNKNPIFSGLEGTKVNASVTVRGGAYTPVAPNNHV